MRESTDRVFEAYGAPLENVTTSKYLGRVMTAGYDDWPEVIGNLQMARNSWGRLSRILIREGADLKVSVHFFKAEKQAVLLFGAEMWVLTPRMELPPNSLQHRVARWLNVRQTRIQGDRSWEYP